jgi:DNA-directed RNA polymerase specialized sigma24 family protein
MASKSTKTHYVNNNDLLAAMVEYKKEYQEAKKNGKPVPRVSEYIGECLLKIASHLSYKPNFYGYTFREDMVGDAILNCMEYIHNFDTDKYKNPFSYFTQIMYFAFIRKLDKEKKHQVLKFKVLENSELYGTVLTQQSSDKGEYDNTFTKYMYANSRDSAHEYDSKKKAKRTARKRANGLSQFGEAKKETVVNE